MTPDLNTGEKGLQTLTLEEKDSRLQTLEEMTPEINTGDYNSRQHWSRLLPSINTGNSQIGIPRLSLEHITADSTLESSAAENNDAMGNNLTKYIHIVH